MNEAGIKGEGLFSFEFCVNLRFLVSWIRALFYQADKIDMAGYIDKSCDFADRPFPGAFQHRVSAGSQSHSSAFLPRS